MSFYKSFKLLNYDCLNLFARPNLVVFFCFQYYSRDLPDCFLPMINAVSPSPAEESFLHRDLLEDYPINYGVFSKPTY